MKVLWLASWYPNRTEPFSGDFIQRHAQAVSQYHDVQVIFVVRDKHMPPGTLEIAETHSGRLSEKIVYYNVADGWLHKAFSFYRYRQLYRQHITAYLQAQQPGLVHVHVAHRAGVLALWIKQRWKIPYVITEHWTGYLPDARENVSALPVYLKTRLRGIFANASGVSAVSQWLSTQLQSWLPRGKSVRVIPNVVDTTVFRAAQSAPSGVVRFIHVSGLDYQKDPESILQAFALLLTMNSGFFLDVFGPDNMRLVLLAERLGLGEKIHFHGEVPQPVLAQYMQQAKALILYSRYETFGCVVIESLACGVPVVASDIPVMRELIQEGVNGSLVKPKDPQQLARVLLTYMENKLSFDTHSIAAATSDRFCPEEVGRKFSEWYQEIILNSKD